MIICVFSVCFKELRKHVFAKTVMFVLNEIVNSGEPQSGDWGVMMALGPGMAAEVALLRW